MRNTPEASSTYATRFPATRGSAWFPAPLSTATTGAEGTVGVVPAAVAEPAGTRVRRQNAAALAAHVRPSPRLIVMSASFVGGRRVGEVTSPCRCERQ